MDEKQATQIMNKVFNNIFGKESPFTLEKVLSKFAFDVKLPQKVLDSIKGKETWTVSVNSNKYIIQEDMQLYDNQKGWMIPKKEVTTLEELLNIWKKTNYITTERVFESNNVAQCDPIYKSENAYRCTDCRECKNLIYTDGCANSEYIIACQRSANCTFCMRVDDSNNCNNSYNVVYSAKINNSLFIQDCNNLNECIFCSHIANKKYCIANMQYEAEEYFVIKKTIISWILQN